MIKEPKEIDLIIESQELTEEELADFRILMQKLKNEQKRIPKKVKRLRNKTKAKVDT